MKIEPVIVKYIAEIDKKSFDSGVQYAKQVKTQMEKGALVKFSAEISELKAKLKEAQALLSAETNKEKKAKLSVDATAITNELKKVSKQFQTFLTDLKKNNKVKVDIDIGTPTKKQVQQVIDSSGFDRGVKTAFDTGKKIDQKVFVKILGDTVDLDNKLKQVRAKINIETNKENLVKLRLEEKLLKEQLTQVNREFKNLSNNADTALSRLQAKFNQVTTGIGTGANKIVAELAKIGTAFKEQGASAGFSQLGSTVGKGIGSLAGSIASGALSVAGGLGIVAGLQQVGQFFSNATAQARAFEKGMANINTVLNLSQSQLKTVGNEVLALSDKYGRTTEEIQNLFFEIASAGYTLESIPSLAETSLRGAIASGEGAVDVFKGVNAVIKAYDGTVGNAAVVADKFFKANVQGQLTVGELSREVQGVTGSARALGITLDEVLASYTLFTGVIGNSSEVTTGLSRTFDALSSPGTQALETLEAYKISYNQLQAIIAKPVAEGGGFLNAVKLITDAVGNNNLALGKIFNNVNAYKIATIVATKSTNDFKTAVDGIANSTGAMNKALEEATKTEDFQITLQENKWRNAQTNIGNYIVRLIGNILSIGKQTALLVQIVGQNLFLLSATLVQGGQRILAAFSGIFTGIGKLFTVLEQNAVIFGKNFSNGIANGFASLENIVTPIFNGIISKIESFINKGIGGINKFTSGVNDAVGTSIGSIKEIKLPKITGGETLKKELLPYQEIPKIQQSINEATSKINPVGEAKVTKASNALKDLQNQLKNVKGAEITRLFDDLANQARKLAQNKAGFDDGTGDKDKDKKTADKARKEALDAELKRLDLIAQKEVEVVKKSTLSEAKKAEKIIKIYEDLDKRKGELQDKYNKSVENANKNEIEEAKKVLKNTEENKKKAQDAYDKTGDAIEKSLDKLIDFEKEQQKINKQFDELKDKAKDSLREVANDLSELTKEANKQLANQSLDTAKNLDESKQKITQLSKENTSVNLNDLPRSIADVQKQIDQIDQQIVNLNPGDARTKETVGNLSTQRKEYKDTIDELKNYQKLVKDNEILQTNTTPAQREEAKRVAALTEGEKILEEAQKKRLELQEKQAINSAFASSKIDKPNIVETENGISVIDEQGKVTQITDFKNQEYARDLLNQQKKLQLELKTIEDQKTAEKKILKKYYDDKKQQESDYTLFFQGQVALQAEQVQKLIDKQRELNALRAGETYIPTVSAAPDTIQKQDAPKTQAYTDQVKAQAQVKSSVVSKTVNTIKAPQTTVSTIDNRKTTTVTQHNTINTPTDLNSFQRSLLKNL